MELLHEIWESIIEFLFITSSDSEESKATKIMWYTFFGSIIAIGIVSWGIFVGITFSSGRIKVPNIEGDNVYIALKKMSDKKLIVQVKPDFSDKYSEGVVFNQSPNPGAVVKKGRTVKFSVSLGSEKDALPEFIGMTLFEIAAYLEKTYPNVDIPYEVAPIVYQSDENVDKWRILKQEPPGGTPVKNVKKVKLWVSTGIKEHGEYVLGGYAGKMIEDVSEELSSMGIYYNVLFVETSNKKLADTVIEQAPGEGFLVSDLFKDKKSVSLKVYRYVKEKKGEVVASLVYSLPNKPLPYKFEIELKDSEIEKEKILTLMTKGNFTFSLPYTAKKYAKLIYKIDGKVVKEEDVKEVEKR